MKNLFDKSEYPEKQNRLKYISKILRLRALQAPDTTVIETTVSKSWDDVRTNKLASSGASSGVTAFIILLVLFLICVTAFLIFLWTKRGYPVVTLNSVLSRLPTIPGMSSSSGSSFSFARFSNERISNINIGATISAEIQQTEKVDTETNPIGLNSPPEIGPDGAGGFINATYDLLDIAGPSIKSLPTLPEDDHIYDLVDVHGDSSAILQASKKEE